MEKKDLNLKPIPKDARAIEANLIEFQREEIKRLQSELSEVTIERDRLRDKNLQLVQGLGFGNKTGHKPIPKPIPKED